jgi:DNA-binding GntR family transcriptional regulator
MAANNDGSAASVAQAITDEIMHGTFVPGQRLVEVDLAEHFSTSRARVRAALFQLANDGLVEHIQNRGARVRAVPFGEAIEISEVRMALEGLCAAKAAERVTDDDIETLNRIGEDMVAAVNAGNVMGYSTLNSALHEQVRTIGQQKTASQLLAKLRAQNVRYQFRLATHPGRPSTSLPEHLRIIEAITSRDPHAAEAAMRAHIASVIEAMNAIGARQENASGTLAST